MLVNEESLPEAYALALAERAKGRDYVVVELVPRVRVAKYVQLWEGILGEVVGRRFYDEPNDDGGSTQVNPDMPASRIVRLVQLRVRIADVTEAMRRFVAREKRELRTLAVPNRVAVRRGYDTAR